MACDGVTSIPACSLQTKVQAFLDTRMLNGVGLIKVTESIKNGPEFAQQGVYSTRGQSPGILAHRS